MTTRHTLLFRLIGPMQAWGYRSRFEDRDTALEPTRSGVLGLLASACGIPRTDTDTLIQWDETLRFGVRVDLPAIKNERFTRSGFRVETDFHTAQDVLRAAGKGLAETVLSRRHYLTDARYTIGVEAADRDLLAKLENALKNPVWTLCLGRKAFPLALPPWLPKPDGGIRENTDLLDALKAAPFPLLSDRETLPDEITFVYQVSLEEDAPPNGIPMRLADRPLNFDFEARRFGLRDAVICRLKQTDCGIKEEPCFSQK